MVTKAVAARALLPTPVPFLDTSRDLPSLARAISRLKLYMHPVQQSIPCCLAPVHTSLCARKPCRLQAAPICQQHFTQDYALEPPSSLPRQLLKRREAVLSSLAALWFACTSQPAAAVLKSVKSDKSAALTLRNDLEAAARIYWINYDGDS